MSSIKSTHKRSNSFHRNKGAQYFFDSTLSEKKQVDNKISAPFNSWRNPNYIELLQEAMILLTKNKDFIKEQQQYKVLVLKYKQLLAVENTMKSRSNYIKHNIENMISSQTEFQDYLNNILL